MGRTIVNKNILRNKGMIDYPLMLVSIIMIAFGTLMVASASAPSALNAQGDAFYFLKRQLFILPVGFAAMFLCMFVDVRYYKKFSKIIYIVTLVLLALVVVPGVGVTRNGATRWLGVGSLQIQPSEIAKIAVVIFFSARLSRPDCQIESFTKGLIPNLCLLGIACGLIIIEPHMSGCIIVGFAGALVIFLAGAKIKHFLLLAAPVVVAAVALVVSSPYRMSRITAFLDPFADIRGEGWQIVNSLFAIGSGGLFGKGLGKSTQKYLYLPEPQNDFILSVIAEELGFIGVILVIALFVFFIYRGIRIAMKAPDKFTSLLAAGLTGFIAIEALINIAVVTSSVPVTGMPLPFFSYGGTSLVFLMASVGILLNISRYTGNNFNPRLVETEDSVVDEETGKRRSNGRQLARNQARTRE